MKPQKHEQESQRLEALKSLNILDTLPESEFNDIVFLASQICQTPMALFSLVDENRQWFKAKVGVDMDQTPRDISFCGHAINSKDPFFIVTDARQDDRFAKNPLVLQSPQIQFYAAVTVDDPTTNLPIGTICALDSRPRELNQSQLDALLALKNQIQIILKNKIEHAALQESQEKIQEINQRQDLILEMSGLGSWELDVQAGLVLVDRNWSEILGLPNSELGLSADDWMSRLNPEDAIKVRKDMNDYLTGVTPVYETVYRIKNASGHWLWVLSRGKICGRDHNGNPQLIMGTNYDLTQYKKRELIAFEFQKLASIGGWELDLQKNELFWTEQIYSIYGLDRSTEINIDLSLNYFSSKDRDRLVQLLRQCTQGEFFRQVFDFVDFQKNKKIVELTAGPITNANGMVTSLRGTFQDVTDRVISEKRLREAQEIAKIGSWEFDLKTQYLTWSTEHYRIFEISEPQSQEQLYALYRSRIHPEDIQELDVHIHNAIEMGSDFTYNHRVYLNNGEKIKYVQGIGRVVKDVCGLPISVMGTCQDITEKYLAEKELEESRLKAVQAAKLASIGEVAAGIAHEINNPLAIISGTIALLDRYVHDEVKLKSKIETVAKSIQRITKIVSGLKKFSRVDEKQDFKNNIISEIIQEVLVLSEIRSHGLGVEVTADVQTSAMAFCDALEIEQVLVNLINNSIDAVKNLSEKWVRIHLFEEGSQIVLQVVDSGSGISPAVESKLFQPFFTTKPVGEGTGLGLSICKGIMDKHNADFFLNRTFSNTCFELRFNRVESQQSVA